LEHVIAFVEKHNKFILILIFLITLFFALLIPQLELNSEYITLLPPDPKHEALKAEIMGDRLEYPGDLYFMVEGPKIFEKETLQAIEEVLAQLDAFDELGESLSPFEFVTVQKKGTRLVTLPTTTHKKGTIWTQEEADTFKERVLQDEISRGLLTSPEGDALLFFYATKDLGKDQKAKNEEFSRIIRTLESYAKVYIIGTPLFEDRVMLYLFRDLDLLLVLCMLVIVLLYYLSFRAKRAVFIPFSLSLIGIIWTLGMMVLLDYSLTVVTIITPSMVLILGSSYSIHVISEYYRSFTERHFEVPIHQQIATSVAKINRTIFIACLTTVVGFLSLLICELPAFRELGIAVSLGITSCALLSLTYIPALLCISSKPKPKQIALFSHGKITTLVHKLSLEVGKRWPLYIILLLLIIGGFIYTKDKVTIQTDYLTYFPKHDQLIKESISFARKMGGTDPHYITLTAPENESGYFYRSDVIQSVYAFEEALRESDKDITHILSFSQYVAFLNKKYQGEAKIPDTPGLVLMLSRLLKMISSQVEHQAIEALINEDGSRVTLSIRYYDSKTQSWESLESVTNLQQTIEKHRNLLPQEISLVDWGVGVNALRLSESIKRDQKYSMYLSILLVFIIVCIQFKSAVFGIYAIIPTLSGIMGNYIFMFLLDIPFDVITIIFASITIGIGVDNAIHYLLRFKNRCKEHPNLPYRVSIAQTLEETGRPILLTSSSIILGLLVLLSASFIPIRYFGLLLAIALFTTTWSTLFILPSVMIAVHSIKQTIRRRTESQT